MPSMVVYNGFELADVVRGGVASSTGSVLTSRLTLKTSSGSGVGGQAQPSMGSSTASGSGKGGLGGLSREMAKQGKSPPSASLNQMPSKTKRVSKTAAGGDDDVRGGSPPNTLLGTSLSSSLHMGRHVGHSEPRGSAMFSQMRGVAMPERFGHATLKSRAKVTDTFGVGSAPVCSSYDGLWTTNFQDLKLEESPTENPKLKTMSIFEQDDHFENDVISEACSSQDVEEISEGEVVEEELEQPPSPATFAQRNWNDVKETYPVLKVASVEKAHALWQKTNYKKDLDVALILCELGVDANCIETALVQQGMKTEAIKPSDLSPVIASITDQVHDVEKMSTFARGLTRKQVSAEARSQLQKAFLSVSDVRALVVALAKRVIDLRNLKKLLLSQRKKLAEETLAFYVPLASRLGMWAFKAEMEDVCFATLDPAMYNHLKRAAGAKEDENRECLAVAIQELETSMKGNNIDVLSLSGRPKTLYSMFEKMRLKKKREDEILDKRGIRILVEKEFDCYRALKVVHSIWEPLDNSFKDYIAKPKENGYKSIHTVVKGPSGLLVEVQIRTTKMHLVAEHGIAAHWKYKELGEQKLPQTDVDRHIKLARDSLHDIIRKCGRRSDREDSSSESINPRKLERSRRREALMN